MFTEDDLLLRLAPAALAIDASRSPAPTPLGAVEHDPDAPHAAEVRAALTRPVPSLPPRWFWGPAATLHRERARVPDHYPSRVDRELFAQHASVLVGLFEPRAIVDLAPAATRHVRHLADALQRDRRRARCALHDWDGPRLVAAVRRLAADYPNLDVSGVLGADPSRIGRDSGRLVLMTAGGPDGPEPGSLLQTLRAVAPQLGTDDAVVLTVDLGADPDALVRACRDPDGVAEAMHRAALASCVEAFGGEIDPTLFQLEATWDGHAVATRLRPARPVRLRLPGAGVDVRLDGPIRTGRTAAWTRPILRRVAARGGLALGAWLPDPEERRAIVVLRCCAGCGSPDHLL
ncbi:MAG: L-histidine N(alpha)-methyltransferase [Myxococcota bacterium]